MTDISHLEFLPALINKVIDKLAPDVRVEVLRITSETPKLLESGEADLAVGFMAEETGSFQRKLFDQIFACVETGADLVLEA